MPKRIFRDEPTTEGTVEEQAVLEPAVKQMVRTISSVTNEDHDNVLEVDAEIGSWLKKGFKLLNAQIVGNDQQGVSVYYMLVRQ